MSNTKGKKLLDEVRDIMRLQHDSIHTDCAYADWIKRYILYHKMTSRADLAGGEGKFEQFLTYLAIEKDISPATQRFSVKKTGNYSQLQLTSYPCFII